MVANKISRVIGILFRLKNIFPKEILLTLYNTLIYSYINYGLLVWGIESSRIEALQKRAIRLVTNSAYIAHTTPLFIEEGLLKVQDIFKLKLLKFYYKLSNNLFRHTSRVILMSLIENLYVHCASILYINL